MPSRSAAMLPAAPCAVSADLPPSGPFHGSSGVKRARRSSSPSPAASPATSVIRAAAAERAPQGIAPVARTSRSAPAKPYVPSRNAPRSGRRADDDRAPGRRRRAAGRAPAAARARRRARPGRRRRRRRRRPRPAARRRRRGRWRRRPRARRARGGRGPRRAPARRGPGRSARRRRPSTTRPSGPAPGEPNVAGPAESTLRARRPAWTSPREDHERAQPGGRGRGRDGHGVLEVRRPVGAHGRGGADRARQDDRGLGVVQERAQRRGLLERVGPVGDDHAAARPRLVGRGPGHGQGVVERELGAGQGGHRPGPQRAAGEGRDGRDEGVGVERRHGAGPRAVRRHGAADHRDRPTGGQDRDLALHPGRPTRPRRAAALWCPHPTPVPYAATSQSCWPPTGTSR